MENKSGDKPQYNLRPRTSKNNTLKSPVSTPSTPTSTLPSTLSPPLPPQNNPKRSTPLSKEPEKTIIHSDNSEDDEEEIVFELPEEVMEEINIAIQDLVEEVTEDIINKVSEIVVSSIEHNLNEGECVDEGGCDGDGVDDLDEDLDEDYKPNDIYNIFTAVSGINDGSRKKMYLSKDRWKQGLTEQEIKDYSYIFDDLKSENVLSISKIIRGNLSNVEKERAIKVFLNSNPNSNACDEILKTIYARELNPPTEKQLLEMDHLEKEVSESKKGKSILKEKIYKLDADLSVKSAIYEKYLQYESLTPASSESSKLREWLNWTTRLPWNKEHQILSENTDNHQIQKCISDIKLNLEHVYGLNNAKEEIMMYVLRRLCATTPVTGKVNTKVSLGGQILAIEGSPGVGKTFLLKHLASAMNIPFESIPLGGCKDSSFLDGHGYTYEGSTPGRIVQALKNMNCSNGIMYFDEIDKLSDTNNGQEVSSLMLHILDPSQNKEFYDKYIGDIPIDLSKIFFVLSINDREKIDQVLRQRLFIIKIPDPTIKDKIQIAKQCMIPAIRSNFGFEEQDITFTEEALNYLIQHKTNDEKGVRNLKHLLLAIYKRLLFLHKMPDTSDVSFFIKNFKLPFVVTNDAINHLLKGAIQNTEISQDVKRIYV